MSNTTSKPEESAAPKMISKETMEAYQREFATHLELDKDKKVSGVDYLMIFVGVLIREGFLNESDSPTFYSMVKGMKSNNSALRQWLYESKEKTSAPSAMASKYANLGG